MVVLFFSRLMRLTGAFIVIVVLARYLGPEYLGKYLFVMAVVGFMFTLTMFGLDTMIVREVSRNKEKATHYFVTVLLLQFTLILSVYGILGLILYLINIEKELTLAIFLASLSQVIMFSIAELCISIFYAFEKMKYQIILETINKIFDLAFLGIVVYWDLGFLKLFLAMFCSSTIFASVALWVLFKKIGKPRLHIDIPLMKFFFVEAIPLAFNNGMRQLFSRMGVFFVKYFSGDAAVAFFNAPLRLLFRLSIIPDVFEKSVFPILSRIAPKNNKKVFFIFNESVKFMGIISIPLTLSICFYAKEVVSIVLGKGFENAVLPLQILAWIIIPSYLNKVTTTTLLAMNRQKTVAYVSAFFYLAANLILNLLLVPLYGYIGAALAILVVIIGQYVSLEMCIAFHVPLLSAYRQLIKPIICGTAMAVFWLGTRQLSFLFTFPVGICLFFLLLIATKALSENEIEIIKMIFTKKTKGMVRNEELKIR